jgi:protein SCO1
MDEFAGLELSESEIAEHIGFLAASSNSAALLALLRESSALWSGRSAAAVHRIRGALLLALARGGRLPESALIHVLEEVGNGRAPFPVSAAASVLTAAPRADPAYADHLVRALVNLRDHNDYVDLSVWGGVASSGDVPTARQHVLRALFALGRATASARVAFDGWLAADRGSLTPEESDAAHLVRTSWAGTEFESSCCDDGSRWGALRDLFKAPSGNLDEVTFEDQDGQRLTFAEALAGKPAVVVFFYTRCDNPDKCALTLSKLAQVQQRLAGINVPGGVRTVAITYDPGYDQPARLRAHAHSRGLHLGPDHRVLRAVHGWDTIRAHFELGVSYVDSLVNQHRIEAYLLDAQATVRVAFERLQWDPDHLVLRVLALANEPAEPAAKRPKRAWLQLPMPVLALLLALFPKCPICGVAYLSLTGMAVLPSLPGPYLWLPVLLALLAANVAGLWWSGRGGTYRTGLLMTTGGAGLSVIAGFGLQVDAGLWTGLALVTAGALSTLWKMRNSRSVSSPSAPHSV